MTIGTIETGIGGEEKVMIFQSLFVIESKKDKENKLKQ